MKKIIPLLQLNLRYLIIFSVNSFVVLQKINIPKHSCFVKSDDILGLYLLKRDRTVMLLHCSPWSTQGRGKLSRAPAAELLFNLIAKLSNQNPTGSVGIQGAARPKPWKSTYECPWCLPPSYPHAPVQPQCCGSHQKREQGMDATVDTFYKSKWICYQGAYADGIPIKHAMVPQKRDSPVTKAEGVGLWRQMQP